MRKIIFAVISLLLVAANAIAQDSLVVSGIAYRFIPGRTDTVNNNGNTYLVKYIYQPDEAYIMRSNGKIYVVVVVLATIFAGIFAYLVYLNRKVTRLEQEK